MSHRRRPAESYVHGLDGPAVVVPARVAAWLEREGRLQELRTSIRGLDTELDSVLTALGVAAAAWRSRRGVGSVHGTDLAQHADEPSGWPLTTADAAQALQMSERGVRKAITDQRLTARWAGDVWLITREDLEQFRARREPADDRGVIE